jgi:beta-xylosidase
MAAVLVCITSTVLMPVSLSAAETGAPASQQTHKQFVYQNPIVSEAIENGIRDPSIVNWSNRYYLTGTCYPFTRGARTGVKLWSSDDLKNWKSEGFLIDSSKLPEDVWYRDTFWANEIHIAKGRFWLSFNAANMSEKHKAQHSCGLAVAEKITGPYTVLTTHKSLLGGAWGNDMTLFTDDDGKTYAYWKSHYVQELDLEKAKLVGPRKATLVGKVPGTWEHIGIEGSFVIKRAGVYYMFYSSWSRGYEVGYATAPHPLGPWTKYKGNPIYGAQNPESCQKNGLAYTGNPDSPFLGAGHCTIFTGPDGRDWITAHCTLKAAKPDEQRYQQNYRFELVYDPIWIDKAGGVHADGPTWTRQTILLPQ